MKKITCLAVNIFLGLSGFSQHSGVGLIEYQPAPGQHINIENIGTPEAAQNMTEDSGSLVSLGSFGGYIVLGFEKACINHPDNPYGIDFTLFGNAFSGSSEPGVVWVMQDENKNGLPDDTWYEIAGSHHFHPETVKNYEVTYFRTETRDVFWKDNKGKNGWILANSYNLQEYYPTEQFFPQYPLDSVTFKGTLLKTEIDFSNTQKIKVTPPVFGYADSHPRKQGVDLFLPDNPYTSEIEGAGGDPIDIAWAVDSLGNYVEPDSIHFVKIVSGNLASAGWLGEISTDVAWVEAVKPNEGISGKENLLVVYPHPSKVLVGDSVQLETAYFEKGRKTEASVAFSSQNAEVLEVNSTGLVAAKNLGESEISVFTNNETETIALKVVRPDSIQLLTDFSSVYPGDTLELIAQVFDNEQEKLDVSVQFDSSNPAIAAVENFNGKFFLVARQPGEIVLTCTVEGFSTASNRIVKVHSPDDKIRVYFSAKTEAENLLPFQWIEVKSGDLNGFVEDRQSDYSNLERPTLFHALAAGLQKAEAPFSFKDDEAAGGRLYLYAVENDGLFSYGWGGKTEPSAYAQALLVRLNSKQYLNSFHQIEISDGDTIVLYHVSDIKIPWNYSRLTADKDSAGLHDEIEVQLLQKTCEFSGSEIIESDFVPVANAEIFAGNLFYTDEQGRVVFLLETEPPLVVSSGSDGVLIAEKLVTGNDFEEQTQLSVYPNPAESELSIDGIKAGGILESVIQICTPEGQMVLEKGIDHPTQRLNLSSLAPGIYFLKIIQGKKTETHKIIKK
jgi:hypothetical protein